MIHSTMYPQPPTLLRKSHTKLRALHSKPQSVTSITSIPRFDLRLGDRLARTKLNPRPKAAQNPKSNPTYAIAPKR
jgi:hypothetical protein